VISLGEFYTVLYDLVASRYRMMPFSVTVIWSTTVVLVIAILISFELSVRLINPY
jgi:hypothetical protein